jgi:outer membrane protein TolC
MNMIRKSLFVIIIPGFVLKGFGQGNNEILKLSIAEAQAYAMENNRIVKSSKIDISLAEKKIWENLALGFPQVSLAANYLHQFVVPEVSFGPFLDKNLLPDGVLTKQDFVNAYKDSPPIPLGVMDNTTFDLTLSQLVFDGQYFVGLKAARVVKQVSEKAFVKSEDQIKESVADTYYQLLVLQENIKLLKESKKALDQTYDELVKMNQQGLNEETDVDQMNISRSNIQTLITSLESQKEISVKLLKYQLGLGFEKQVALTDSLTAIIEQGNTMYLSSPEFKLQNSVDYQMIGIQEKISELLLKLQKAKYLPSISAFYRHQEQTNQPSFNFAVKDVIGATLNFPIVTSGMRSAKVSQAAYDLEKLRLNKLDAEQGLTMEFETAWNSYQTAFSNFTTNHESMDLSKKVYDRTVIKYREGVSSSFELAQNQNQFLLAETNYYNSLLSLLIAKAKLDRILRTN